jgi:hypothetical protein
MPSKSNGRKKTKHVKGYWRKKSSKTKSVSGYTAKGAKAHGVRGHKRRKRRLSMTVAFKSKAPIGKRFTEVKRTGKCKK